MDLAVVAVPTTTRTYVWKSVPVTHKWWTKTSIVLSVSTVLYFNHTWKDSHAQNLAKTFCVYDFLATCVCHCLLGSLVL